jgi:hypothetical protein
VLDACTTATSGPFKPPIGSPRLPELWTYIDADARLALLADVDTDALVLVETDQENLARLVRWPCNEATILGYFLGYSLEG